MELSYLVYTGTKEGDLTVRQESALSPFRRLPVSPGKRWRVGRDIPARVSTYLMEMRRQTFKLEVVKQDDEEYMMEHFTKIFSGFDMSKKEVVIKSSLSALMEIFPDDAQLAINSLATPKKTKTTRKKRSTPPSK